MQLRALDAADVVSVRRGREARTGCAAVRLFPVLFFGSISE